MKERIPFYNEMMVPYHVVRAGACAVRRRFPARRMRVVGVTGTNGKTTTCFLIWKMLSSAGIKTGVMTTVGWGVEKIHKQIEHMTTESSTILNKRIAQLAKEGVEVLVLEVTSHALAQGRIVGIPIEVAVMTNVTHDHLDYHKTFERYVRAKAKLFKRAKFGVINADDASFEVFRQAMKRGMGRGKLQEGRDEMREDVRKFCEKNYTSYGINDGDLRASKIKMGVSGVEYACDDMMKVKVGIPGKFNVYNSLAAVSVGKYFGLTKKQIERGIEALKEVEGRMNLVEVGQDFKVLVDYAHTPDAFVKVFEAMGREVDLSREKIKSKKVASEGRIITIHGGAGRRDESTRYDRGFLAGQGSDVFIVTEDDSRDEDPKKIAGEFVRGAKDAGMKLGKNLFVEIDRRKAIAKAVKMAKKDDVVLVLGKGHEKTILRANGAEPFEDLKVSREELLKIMKKSGR